MNHATIAANLKAARALIATPESWTQQVSARDADGHPVMYNTSGATCFCSYGALRRLQHITGAPRDAFPEESFFLSKLLKETTGDKNASIVAYNDNHTHAEVLAVWDKGIAKAEALAVVDNLVAAKAKIEKPENWTTGAMAKDARGREVDPASTDAVCFCTIGAIKSITGQEYTRGNAPEYNLISRAVPSGLPMSYNDDWNRTHGEVLAAFDKAIELAQAEANVV